MTPLIAALKGLASLPSLIDSVNGLVDRLGALEKAINEKQVQERLKDKRSRNSAAIKRVLARQTGSKSGTSGSPTI